MTAGSSLRSEHDGGVRPGSADTASTGSIDSPARGGGGGGFSGAGVSGGAGTAGDGGASGASFRLTTRVRPAGANPTPLPAAGSDSDGTPGSRGGSGPEDDGAFEMEDALSEENIKLLAGADDLSSVTRLEISVNTREQSVARLGELLPALRELKLNESELSSIRDLGTNLWELEVLWVRTCGLKDIDGIGAMEGLKELYLSYNDVSDLTPLLMHEQLEVIDLEANAIADMSQLDVLATCKRLRDLTLTMNPIESLAEYRRLVVSRIPQLESLDDEEITADDRREPSAEAVAAAAEGKTSPMKPRVSAAHLAEIDIDFSDLGDLDRLGLSLDEASAVDDTESTPAATGGTGSAGGGAGVAGVDDAGKGDSAATPRTPRNAREHEWEESMLLADAIKTARADSLTFASPTVARPSSAGARRRPLSAGDSPTRPHTARADARPRTASASRRPSLQIRWEEFSRDIFREEGARSTGGSSFEDDAASRASSGLGGDGSGASDLTSGLAFAGNPAMAIRRRKRGGAGDDDVTDSITGALDRAAEIENASTVDAIAELKAWDLDAEVAKLKANPALRERLVAKAAARPGTSGGIMGRSGSSPALSLRHPMPNRPPARAGSPAGEVDGERVSPVHPRSQRFREFSGTEGPVRPVVASNSAMDVLGRGPGAGPVRAISPRAGVSITGDATSGAVPPGRPPTAPAAAARRPPTAPARSAAVPSLDLTSALRRSAGAAEDGSAASGALGAVPSSRTSDSGSMGDSERLSDRERPGSTGGGAQVLGEAYFQPDDELVHMLQQRPKHVPAIRTREGFRRYFRGLPRARVLRLLHRAYASLPDGDRDAKVAKRIGLLDGLLTDEPDEEMG